MFSIIDLLLTCRLDTSFASPGVSTVRVRPLKATATTASVTTSKLVDDEPNVLDLYGHVCGPGTYVPNIRIQKYLIDAKIDQQDILGFQDDLSHVLKYVDSFRGVAGGSETVIVESNLQNLLRMMSSNKFQLHCMKLKLPISHIASACSSEHCLYYQSGNTQHVLVGTEAKGIEYSIRHCYAQLLSVCGSSCIELLRKGVALTDCVIPGIALSGSTLQVCAVYLLRDSCPVMVALTPELCLFGSLQEKHAIADWCLRVKNFALETLGLLNPPAALPPPVTLCLNMDGYFVKPVRIIAKVRPSHGANEFNNSNWTFSLNHVMQLYEQLRLKSPLELGDIRQLVLFPEGVVTMPGEGLHLDQLSAIRGLLQSSYDMDRFKHVELFCPLILFPQLSDETGWSVSKPSEDLRESYLTKLRLAVRALNAAEIAHLDLRPANIMWRRRVNESTASSVATTLSVSVAGEVDLRLIDFEDALFFGHKLHPDVFEYLIRDARYPFDFRQSNVNTRAKMEHNEFFLEAVSQWAFSETDSFEDFMASHGAEIMSTTCPVTEEEIDRTFLVAS